MSAINWEQYKTIDSVEKDIKSIKIQGATNVALATIHGIILHGSSVEFKDWQEFYQEIEKVGNRLASARPNEPLAKNGVKYILYTLKTEHGDAKTADQRRDAFLSVANTYLKMIKEGKKKIVDNSQEVMKGVDEVFTHCHSSTAENVIKAQNERANGLRAVCTETRPLFQGRITAANLISAGIDTTMVADSAAESFIIGRGTHGIDVILIGADELTPEGDGINKIGSWGVALASYYANKPIYVVSSILKIDVTRPDGKPQIEMREAKELWEEAPKELKLVNPAFELIDHQFITGFITEEGVLKPDELLTTVKEKYGWVF